MIQRTAIFILSPLIRLAVRFGLWRAARRNRRDNTFTIEQLESFHQLLTKNRKS